jgi:hypothetical protein
MEDQVAAQGQHREVAEKDPVISTDTLRAVSALEAQLEPVLPAHRILPPHMIHNVNDLEEKQLSLGDRIADWVIASPIGWPEWLALGGSLLSRPHS